jgi:hypothetical protein
MGWKKELKKIRRWQTQNIRNINRWITLFYREQKNKQEQHFMKLIEGQLEKEYFLELLDTNDAIRNFTKDERDYYKANFEKVTESDISNILKKVFPREFTIQSLIESMYQKDKNSFTPSEWNEIYSTAIRYFSRERGYNVRHLLEAFWNDEVYQNYVNNGHTDSELFDKFIDTCSEYQVYPIYCDNVDGYYKLLDLEHYVQLLKQRTFAIASEIKRRSEEVKAIQAKGIDLQLPSVDGEFSKRITSGDNPYETLKFPLPPPKEKEIFICPFETCKRKFTTKSGLQRHLIHKHKAHAE